MYLTYGGTFGRIRALYFRKILERLALDAHAKVLDYGCGPGDFLLVARSQGIAATGIDASPRSVRLAAERGLNVICGETAELLARPERYDAILVQSVLEHALDGVKLVTDLRDLLVPGGVLVLSAPTPGSYFWDDPTHVRPYTPKSFSILAEIAAMKCEYLGYVFSFLLGTEIRASIFFRLLNAVPASLGSNIVAFFRKPAG
jgi:2-polyprenyl-3-methyl-5-hydroxy-6-metoxy-1,4-benzoquinol methylase